MSSHPNGSSTRYLHRFLCWSLQVLSSFPSRSQSSLLTVTKTSASRMLPRAVAWQHHEHPGAEVEPEICICASNLLNRGGLSLILLRADEIPLVPGLRAPT